MHAMKEKKSTRPAKSKAEFDDIAVFSDLGSLFSSTFELGRTLQETVAIMDRAIKPDACFIYLLDKATGELTLSAAKATGAPAVGHVRFQIGEGLTGWVAKNHRTVAIEKNAHKDPRFLSILPEDKFEAFIGVPVMSKNDTIGVMNIQFKKAQKFSERLPRLLAAVGRQIGAAIEASRLYGETRQRTRTLEALQAVSHTLAQDRYPEEIMQMIVNMTAQMMGSSICSVMLLDEKGQELKIVAAHALDPAYLHKPPVKVHGSLTGRAVTSKHPVATRDVRKEASYQFRDLAMRQGLVSLLSVPMLYKSKVLGVFNAYSAEEHTFTADEISFVQSVANQCAAAIENTRLLSEKLAAQEALETRKIIERAKGLLMQQRGLNEQQAFREIQQQSMDRRKTMKEIGEALILAYEMKS